MVREEFVDDETPVNSNSHRKTTSIAVNVKDMSGAYKFVQETFTRSVKDVGFEKLPVLTAECNYSQKGGSDAN